MYYKRYQNIAKTNLEFRSRNILGDHRSGICTYATPTSSIQAVCITGNENNLTTFNEETYQKFLYDMSGMTGMTFTGAEHPSDLDNRCTFFIMPKSFVLWNSAQISENVIC